MTTRYPDDDVNPALSAEIDHAQAQIEAATDPAVRTAWRRVLDELEAMLPPGVGEPHE